MPIYEYECPKCGRLKEQYRTFRQMGIRPVCCGRRMEMRASKCDFRLKGKGWYATEYGGKRDA